MITNYEYLKLLNIDEFDAIKQAERYGSKEAFFAHLFNFTNVSEIIMKKCELNGIGQESADIQHLASDMQKLQGLLVSIGAINLRRAVQIMEKHCSDNNYAAYADGIGKLFSAISGLRKKIIESEKPAETDFIEEDSEYREESPGIILSAPKEKAEIQREEFDRLFTLIDNFKYDSAMSLLRSKLRYSYSDEIDELLDAIHTAMYIFDYDSALKDAARLVNLITPMDKVRKRVLIIDDIPEMIRDVKSMLRDRYAVFGMTNYNSAIKFLTEITVDLILLDIEMPYINGFAMLEMIRKLPNYEKIPVIFLTGNATPENVLTAVNMGAVDFIAKPVDEQVMLDKVMRVLDS